MSTQANRRALVRCSRCRAEYEVRWPGTVKVLSDGTRDFQPAPSWSMQTVCPVCRRRTDWYWLRWLGPVEETGSADNARREAEIEGGEVTK